MVCAVAGRPQQTDRVPCCAACRTHGLYCCFILLPRDIVAVKGLTDEESDALHASMSQHAKPVSSARKALWAAAKNPAVWVGGLGIKFFRDVGFYGLIYW